MIASRGRHAPLPLEKSKRGGGGKVRAETDEEGGLLDLDPGFFFDFRKG